MGEVVNVKFIIPKDCTDENECSEEMQLAFTTCKQLRGSNLQAEWVKESSWDIFEGLTKANVFVFNEFTGDLFEKLGKTKCLILGPRCLSCCLTEKKPIPYGPEPVFTVAFRDLIITASGLTKAKKDNIKQKVFWMGGVYSSTLIGKTTHLIADRVLSEKYVKATQNGLPVMSEEWIEKVWETSLQLNVNAASPDFDSYKLPAFANLQVTTSGVTKKLKQTIMKLVEENGGNYSGSFQSEVTDVLVVSKEGVGSEKYKAAVQFGKSVVPPQWVLDSAEKGVALPVTSYKVVGTTTSSPLAEHRAPDMSLNFSRITNNTSVRPPLNFVDETRSMDLSTMSGRTKLSDSKRSSDPNVLDKETQSAFENLDMSLIKKAGPIFDGFCIWVTGLEGVCRDRAWAIVSRGGGIRYEGPHDRVTHIVAAGHASAVQAQSAMPFAPTLHAKWLLDSVIAGKALDEIKYMIDVKPQTPSKPSQRPRAEPASPMSARNLQLLRHKPLLLPPPAPEPRALPLPLPDEDDIVNHYLSQNQSQAAKEKSPEISEAPAPTSTITLQPVISDDEDHTEFIEQIFAGIKIEVLGLLEEAVAEVGAEVAAAGGVLCAAGCHADYVVVPLDCSEDELRGTRAEPITVFWIKDCLSAQELLPIQYYHRPVHLPAMVEGEEPLVGVVASLSTYSGVERAFLDELAKLLGATTQLRFCRRDTSNAKASTHLICPEPSGDKYQGALKWGLPAVRASWLLEACARGQRVSEQAHLVGDTKATTPLVKESESALAPAVVSTAVDVGDKENAMLPPTMTDIPRRGSLPKAADTPKQKSGEDEMSPASRYIAMARQGLLGTDSQQTPKQGADDKDLTGIDLEALKTPPLDDALSTPNLLGLSPTSRRRIQAVRRGEMPSDPLRTPVDPFQKKVATPDSAFGAALRPGSARLSADSRKRLWSVVEQLPSKQQADDSRHTPLSEIRNRFLAQFNSEAPTPPSDHHHVAPRKLELQYNVETPPSKMVKLQAEEKKSSCSTSERTMNGSSTDVIQTTHTSDERLSSDKEKSSLPGGVSHQLERLNAVLSGRLSSPRNWSHRPSNNLDIPAGPESEPGPESQPNTVGWDDSSPSRVAGGEGVSGGEGSASVLTQTVKRFMLSSNVDNREEIAELIVRLRGEVAEGAEFDPGATHLVCALPGRSEKMLGSVARGRWVLHPAYVTRSAGAGAFLQEEAFEWGNPRAQALPALQGAEAVLAAAAFRWRARRMRFLPGPFAGVVALLHVPPPRRKLLSRLLLAGDGQAPDCEPPYSNADVTVCFADTKRYPLSERDAAWLVSKRIPVCAPVLLSAFLTDAEPPNPADHCLPEFRP